MGGEQIKSSSESQNENPNKTEKVDPGGTGEAAAPGATAIPTAGAGRMAVLGALADGIDVPMDRWPGEVLKAAIGRFARMPRNGWQLCHSIFCDKFKCSMPFAEFEAKANFSITSNAGRRCTRRKFTEDAAKRVKTIDVLFDEITLREARVYQEIRQKYNILMAENLAGEIDKAKWTRKFTSDKADKLVLDCINQAAGEYAARYPPTSMSDIARQLQAAQQCFEQHTERVRTPSPWRASIEGKIASTKLKIESLKRKQNGEKLGALDLKLARRTMREENLILDVSRDLMTAISLLEERVRV